MRYISYLRKETIPLIVEYEIITSIFELLGYYSKVSFYCKNGYIWAQAYDDDNDLLVMILADSYNHLSVSLKDNNTVISNLSKIKNNGTNIEEIISEITLVDDFIYYLPDNVDSLIGLPCLKY